MRNIAIIWNVSTYQDRIIDTVLARCLEDFPAVSIVGPRASGKTTTALRLAKTVLRLDRPGEAAVVEGNPDAALNGAVEPILIDEWQEAPAILGAVKRTVDADPRPGRFLLTGSVRAPLEKAVWPGTGRLIQVPMTTLSVREQIGNTSMESVIDRIARSGVEELRTPEIPLDVRDYLTLALKGGFPEPALRLSARARPIWLESYIHQLVTRDAQALETRRDPARLRSYFEVLALNTAGMADDKTLYEAARIRPETAQAYERLLENLFVFEAVPAWFTNRLKRTMKRPKRYIIDAGLAGAATNVDETALMRDNDLLGRFLDTFVASQIRADLPSSSNRPRMHHLRTEAGRHEIDLILELSGDRIVALEIKAAVAVGESDIRHLRWLRDRIGERFAQGIVLHTGPGMFGLSDRISAAPISVLWS